jgi:hypothetical protein
MKHGRGVKKIIGYQICDDVSERKQSNRGIGKE